MIPLQSPENLPFPYINIETHPVTNAAGNWESHVLYKYSAKERSILAGHRKCAALGGPVLIMEDDVVLPDNFIEKIEAAVALAPRGWEVLQFHTLNTHASYQLVQAKEPFVAWMPEYWSAAMYLLSEESARKIAVKPAGTHPVADYWVYHEMRAFTYTGCLLAIEYDAKTATNEDIGKSEFFAGADCKEEARPNNPDISHLKVVAVTVTNTAWKAKAEAHQQEMKEAYGFGAYLAVDKSSSDEFSSIPHLERFATGNAELLKEYDWVLLYNDHMRFDAYPWNSLMKDVAYTTEIVGIAHESDDASTVSLRQNPIYKEHLKHGLDMYSYEDGHYWRDHCNKTTRHPNPKLMLHGMTVAGHSAALVRVGFFKWYMRMLSSLVPVFAAKKTDVGFSTSWCGAAKEYRLKRRLGVNMLDDVLASPMGLGYPKGWVSTACAVFVMPAWLVTGTSVTVDAVPLKDSTPAWNNGQDMLEALHRTHFEEWMLYSSKQEAEFNRMKRGPDRYNCKAKAKTNRPQSVKRRSQMIPALTIHQSHEGSHAICHAFQSVCIASDCEEQFESWKWDEERQGSPIKKIGRLLSTGAETNILVTHMLANKMLKNKGLFENSIPASTVIVIVVRTTLLTWSVSQYSKLYPVVGMLADPQFSKDAKISKLTFDLDKYRKTLEWCKGIWKQKLDLVKRFANWGHKVVLVTYEQFLESPDLFRNAAYDLLSSAAVRQGARTHSCSQQEAQEVRRVHTSSSLSDYVTNFAEVHQECREANVLPFATMLERHKQLASSRLCTQRLRSNGACAEWTIPASVGNSVQANASKWRSLIDQSAASLPPSLKSRYGGWKENEFVKRKTGKYVYIGLGRSGSSVTLSIFSKLASTWEAQCVPHCQANEVHKQDGIRIARVMNYKNKEEILGEDLPSFLALQRRDGAFYTPVQKMNDYFSRLRLDSMTGKHGMLGFKLKNYMLHPWHSNMRDQNLVREEIEEARIATEIIFKYMATTQVKAFRVIRNLLDHTISCHKHSKKNGVQVKWNCNIGDAACIAKSKKKEIPTFPIRSMLRVMKKVALAVESMTNLLKATSVPHVCVTYENLYCGQKERRVATWKAVLQHVKPEYDASKLTWADVESGMQFVSMHSKEQSDNIANFAEVMKGISEDEMLGKTSEFNVGNCDTIADRNWELTNGSPVCPKYYVYPATWTAE